MLTQFLFFSFNSKLCQFALIFCLCVKQEEPDPCPSGTVSLCAGILLKCILTAQMLNPSQHLKQEASALLCKISVALEHSCQHLLKTKFMTNSSFATCRVKHLFLLGIGKKSPSFGVSKDPIYSILFSQECLALPCSSLGHCPTAAVKQDLPVLWFVTITTLTAPVPLSLSLYCR